MAAEAIVLLVRAVDHRRCVPADDAANATLERLIPGKLRLIFDTDSVHVVRVERQHGSDAQPAAILHRPLEEEAGALLPFVIDYGSQRINPFPRLCGVLV